MHLYPQGALGLSEELRQLAVSVPLFEVERDERLTLGIERSEHLGCNSPLLSSQRLLEWLVESVSRGRLVV